jgi:hypothetical protein
MAACRLLLVYVRLCVLICCHHGLAALLESATADSIRACPWRVTGAAGG